MKVSVCLEPLTPSLLLAVYVKTHFVLTSAMTVKSQWASLDFILSLHNCLEKKVYLILLCAGCYICTSPASAVSLQNNEKWDQNGFED